MMSPNLNIASDSNSEDCKCISGIEIGFDAAAKYYTLTKSHIIIQDGVHIQAEKKLVLTIAQAEKLRDDLASFFGIHEKYK